MLSQRVEERTNLEIILKTVVKLVNIEYFCF